MNLYFIYEFRDTLRSFTLFIAVKTIAKVNQRHRSEFEIELKKKKAGVVHVLQTTQNWSFHVVVLQRTAKICTKSYNARAEPLFFSLDPLFTDVPVAVAVVVILNSLSMTATTTVESPKMAAILQIISWQRHAALVYCVLL